MVDFFPKPNKKLIPIKEVLRNISPIIYSDCKGWALKAWEALEPGQNLSEIEKTWSSKGSGFGHKKLDPNKICPTMMKSPTFTKTGFMHWNEKRSMSIEEMKMICTFPFNWKLGNNFDKAWARLGNAVMPKFMQAIAEHIKKEILKIDKPIIISTFAGTGGSSLGYKWAGYKELLAIDFEPHAIECFKLNFPKVPCWQRDIKTVTGKEILDFCRIQKGDLDLLDGSPPCQGFSIAGKRQINDLRNDLFQHYWRLVKDLEPKIFIMENVPGMMKGKMKGLFIEIMKTLKSGNYKVKCKLMNAKYYNVPQSRERLIFIGVRNDIYNKITDLTDI